ncbi:MAG: DUF115 domain-containing protein [Phycisphaeraceae bacterium]|nr:DUF115 domain-containing protein [Phycisphaeraceae bacterium]
MSPSSENNAIWQANLARIQRLDADLASRLEATQPARLIWQTSRQGMASAAIEPQASAGPDTASPITGGRAVWLASRFDPLAEAKQLLSGVDLQKHATVIFLGLGLGHHVAELATRASQGTLIIVYEPDLSLLRAVLEKIDHTGWLSRGNLILADDLVDRPTILTRLDERMSVLTLGTVLVTHPPTRQRHGAKLTAFGAMMAEVVAYCRTHVATAMVNGTRTVENFVFNLAHYAGGADTNELHNLAQGVPAVCVSAGPSLAKNVDLLRDPAVRSRVIVITAQTTLRPLLDRGIEPDFVTALDYHEISRRFYEGLPPLPGVTLVAEPLANHTILEDFPGPVRLTQSQFLDRLLGSEARRRVVVPYGSTVAHLSFYLAQHLGCDPIILIGQDLGFSDGLYYCPGTAIHQVWAGEFNRFNTVEMMEWQRIVRHRRNLHRMTDVHGRPCFSDEQMQTYLKQFEKDFSEAKQTVIDATEGGLPKAHTTRMTLREAIDRHATLPAPAIPRPTMRLDLQRLTRANQVMRQRRREVEELRKMAEKTAPVLTQLVDCPPQSPRYQKLIAEVTRNRRRVDAELSAALGLVSELNILGAFRRARMDHEISNDDSKGKLAKQIQRDLSNVELLSDACTEMLKILDPGQERLAEALRRSEAAEAQPVAASEGAA